MPTGIYSVFLLVAFAYWLFVLLGVFSTELFDSFDAADGIAEGVGEGVAEGLGEGVAEGLGEGVAEGLGEGVAEGAGEGFLDAAGDAMETAGEAGSALSFASLVGRKNAPITVIFSLLTLLSWFFSIAGMELLAPALSDLLPGWITASLVFFASFALAVPLTRLATTPLRPLFKAAPAQSAADLLGSTCVIETGHVDPGFGMATLGEGGGWAKVHVRARAGNTLKRGDEALLISWSKKDHAYLVEPLGVDAAQGQAQKMRRAQGLAQRN